MTAEKKEARAGGRIGAGQRSTASHATEHSNHSARVSDVECDVAYRDVIRTTGNGVLRRVPATFARCSRCGHEAFAYGQREASVNACLMRLRDECPNKLSQSNFYVLREGQRGQSR
jgi:hypothetical protein